MKMKKLLFRGLITVLFFLGILGVVGNAYAAYADDGFNPNANDSVFSIAVQP